MIVLGIETATIAGSVALISEDEVLAEYMVNTTEGHAETLLRKIDQIFHDTNRAPQECEAVAVSLGPGSFTGLRIGVCTAKAFAFALQKPVVGVSTLEALASNLAFVSEAICPLIDARKGEVYTALYQWEKEKLAVLIPEQVTSPITIIDQLDSSQKMYFLGSGAQFYRSSIQERFGSKAIFSPPSLRFPRASIVAGIGIARLSQGYFDTVDALIPRYLRLSDAEIHWQQKHGNHSSSN